MATPADKYRINALAKDLGVKTKEITDLLSAAGKGQKSPMTALEPDELSLVFEHITHLFHCNQQKSVRGKEKSAQSQGTGRARQPQSAKRRPAAAAEALAHRGARGRHTRYEQCQPRQI